MQANDMSSFVSPLMSHNYDEYESGRNKNSFFCRYFPYFQIFGELMMDQIEERTQCLGPNPFSNCGNSLQEFVSPDPP